MTLFVQPDCRQVLIDEMARPDFPALHVRAVRDAPEPPHDPGLVRLVVDHVFLDFSHQAALFGGCLVQHFLIKVDFLLVLVIAVVLGKDGVRQILPDIEQRIDHALTIGFEHDVEIAAAHRFKPRAGRHDMLVACSPILLHSSISQVPTNLKG